MNNKSIVFGFLRMAGRFYRWAFTNIIRLIRKSDKHIQAIEQKKRNQTPLPPTAEGLP